MILGLSWGYMNFAVTWQNKPNLNLTLHPALVPALQKYSIPNSSPSFLNHLSGGLRLAVKPVEA